MNTQENQTVSSNDDSFRGVRDLSPSERAELDKQIQRAIESGLMPREAPNVFRIFMKDEVIQNITPTEWAEIKQKVSA